MSYPIKSTVILDEHSKISISGTSGLMGSIKFDNGSWYFSDDSEQTWSEFNKSSDIVFASTSGMYLGTNLQSAINQLSYEMLNVYNMANIAYKLASTSGVEMLTDGGNAFDKPISIGSIDDNPVFFKANDIDSWVLNPDGGLHQIVDSHESNSTNSGAFTVNGGIGLTGNLNAGGKINGRYVKTDGDVIDAIYTSGNGLLVKNGTNSFATRVITGPVFGIAINNGDGINDNPTLQLTNDLNALENLSSSGIAIRTGTDTWVTRNIIAGPGITVNNGNGILGDITIQSILDVNTAIVTASTSGLMVKNGTNWFGRSIIAPAAGITITNPNGVSGNPTLVLANDLAALENLAVTGIAVRTATDTWTTRTITGTATGITITNGNGIAGNPTLVLANDLAALENLSTSGFAVRTGTDTWTIRNITAGPGISISNSNGVLGNPTIQTVVDLNTSIISASTSGIIVKNGTNWYGRSIIAPASGISIINPDGIAGNPTLVLSNDLNALENLTTSGIAIRTGVDTWTTRVITGPSAGLLIQNGDGVVGNPTFTLTNDLAAIENLNSNGYTVRTSADTWTTRNIIAGPGISITNPDGVAGNTIIQNVIDPNISVLTSTTSGIVVKNGTNWYTRSIIGPTNGINISNSDGIFGNPTLTLTNDLAAIENLSTSGIAVRVTTDTWVTRTIVGPATGISITNPDGVLGNPALALINDLAALEALSTTGYSVRTGTDTWITRNIVSGPGISITNPDGISGNTNIQYVPDASIDIISSSTSGIIIKNGTNWYGRVIIAPAAGIAITNGDGVVGNPTLSLTNDLSAIENISTSGFAVRTGTDTWTARSLSASTGITITNPNGIVGNPIIQIDPTYYYQSTSGITVSTLQTLVSTGKIVTSTVYYIVNPQQGGTIMVTGVSPTQIDYSAIWLRPTLLYAFGWIRITNGASGSIDSITVNGTAITTGSVSYNTSIVNTVSLVVANINANSGISGYRSIANGDCIVIISTTTGTTKNGFVVSGTTTTLTLGNSQVMTNGANSIVQQLNITYDLANDKIRSAFDPVRNIQIKLSERYRSSFNSDPFNDFRWGEDVFSTIDISDTQIQNNYGITGAQIRNINSNGGDFSGNILAGAGIYNINLQTKNTSTSGYANFKNNLVIGTNSFIDSCDVGFGINGNVITGPSAFIKGIYQSSYSSNASLNIGVSNNALSGAGSSIAGITQNYNDGSTTMGVNGNTLSGASSLISGIVQQGYGVCTISNNILSNTLQFIRSINQYGKDCTINGNTISSGTTNSGILNINQYGSACTINSNTLSNILVSGQGIFNVNMFGSGSGINSMNFAVAADISNIMLSASNAIITGYTFDATMTSIKDIEWNADNTLSMKLTSPTLTGGTNLGATSSPVNIGLIPVTKAYLISAIFEGSGLSSTAGTATLQLAASTDTSVTLTPVLTITEANDISIINGMTSNKTTAANRLITTTIGTQNITTGSFQFNIKLGVSKY